MRSAGYRAGKVWVKSLSSVSSECNDPVGGSCAQIKVTNAGAANGTYCIDPDGAGGEGPFNVLCDMTTSGGGWTLVAKFSNADGRHWANGKERWTSTEAYGNARDAIPGADAKSPAWGSVTGDEFMLTDHLNPGEYLHTNDNCVGDITMAELFTDALENFPWGGDNNYKVCNVDRTYWPTWAAEPGAGNPIGSGNLSLSSNQLVIARTDGGGDTSAVISFFSANYSESDVGIGALENGGAFTDDGNSQDIGGPTGCGYDDAVCFADYPETVMMWVRGVYIDPHGTADAPGGTNCRNIKGKHPAAGSGMFWIDPDGAGGIAAVEVECDMETDGGGWTVVGHAFDENFDTPPPAIGNGVGSWPDWIAHSWSSNNSHYQSLALFDALTDGSARVMQLSRDAGGAIVRQLQYEDFDYDAVANTSQIGACTNMVGTPCGSQYSWAAWPPTFDGQGKNTNCNTLYGNQTWNYHNWASCASDSSLFRAANAVPRPQLLGEYTQAAAETVILVRGGLSIGARSATAWLAPAGAVATARPTVSKS